MLKYVVIFGSIIFEELNKTYNAGKEYKISLASARKVHAVNFLLHVETEGKRHILLQNF